VRRSDSRTTLADVITRVTDSQSLRRSNRAERLAALWVTKDNNGSDTRSIGGRGANSSVVNELGALRVAGENDLGVGAAGRSLSDVSRFYFMIS
jgi:hypothetical protein